MCLQFESFENTGKEEVARNEQFLLFQQYFLSALGWIFCNFHQFEIVVCKLFIMELSKICRLGKG